MNPLEVMQMPLGLLDAMAAVLKDEERAQRREQARARARSHR